KARASCAPLSGTENSDGHAADRPRGSRAAQARRSLRCGRYRAGHRHPHRLLRRRLARPALRDEGLAGLRRPRARSGCRVSRALARRPQDRPRQALMKAALDRITRSVALAALAIALVAFLVGGTPTLIGAVAGGALAIVNGRAIAWVAVG